MALILASGSPRRRELMALIAPDYTVVTSDVDESKIAADTPAHLAQALATAKARAVAALHPQDTVCGFDTRMPGYSYHKLEKFDSADEILKRMENEKQEQ